MSGMQWTAPYFGVQHRVDTPRRTQITVVNYGAFSRAYALDRRGDTYQGFTPVWSIKGEYTQVVLEAQRYVFR